MRKNKRFLAAILALTLTLTLAPHAAARESQDGWDTTQADIAFAAIDAALEQAPVRRESSTDAACAAVEALGYSVNRQGDRFTWVADGVTCTYSPRLREISEKAVPAEGTLDDAQIVTVSYGTRQNGPQSADVVLIEPYYELDSSFTRQYQNECASIAQKTEGTYTLYKTTAATIDVVADAMESAAVVVFDSHGDTDYASGDDYTSRANTSYLLLQTGDGLTDDDMKSVQGSFGSYSHAMYGGSNGQMRYYCVDGTAITNHMNDLMPNSLVWMAICLGMATDGICKPLMDMGAGTVYGYSQSVTFDGDYSYEESFWTSMKNGSDVKTAIAKMKSELGDWDPAENAGSLSQAVRNHVAFPIVVSALDEYPGHGNVDNYQTVNSDWVLEQTIPFAINAVTDNPAYGSVSLQGRTITAVPAKGYYTAGCTVSPADACTVVQDADSFRITNQSADCTVTVHFAAKTPATIHYIVPEGVRCLPTETYAGDTTILATPEGTPTADAHSYSFVGWVKAEKDNVTEKPEIYPAGSSYRAAAEQTFYALYAYVVTDGSVITTGEFFPVENEPGDWSGEYVITYNGTHILDAGGSHTGTAIGSNAASLTLGEAGCVQENDVLQGVESDCVYVFEKTPSGSYTIRMKNARNYLSYSAGNGNNLTTAADASDSSAQWTLTFDNGYCTLRNVGGPSYTLRYNSSSDLFRCYTSGQKPLTLFSGVLGTTYYTTALEQLDPCADGHNWAPDADHSVAATCTAAGVNAFVCSNCGETLQEPVAATGHTFEQTDRDYFYTYTQCSRCGETITEENKPLPFAESPSKQYPDITDTWYRSAADYVISADLMRSTKAEENSFEPNTDMTRAMLVSVLYRLEGSKQAEHPKKQFTDVPEKSWYTDAVLWAAENGIVSGTGDGTTFSPDAKISREQIAVILYNYCKNFKKLDVSKTAALNSFSDAAQVSTWAQNALCWAVAEKLISGRISDGSTLLAPQGSAMRCEVASILCELAKNLLIPAAR